MNKFLLEKLKVGEAFSDDSFVFNDLFFLPKNFPLQEAHVKLLREWNADAVYSNGEVSSDILKKLVSAEKKEEPEQASEQTEYREEKKENTENSSKSLVEQYKSWIISTSGFFNSILTKRELDIDRVKNMVDEICKKVKENKNSTLLFLGKKFEGVSYLFPQSIETVILSVIIGGGLNLSDAALSNLAISALFHDIGMLKIPKGILDKESPLSPDEITIIRNHTAFGYKALLDVKFSPIIASGAYQHHERLDGKGYPNGLTQNKITDLAKIIAVADIYCAAISSKPFKESPTHAKQIIQELLRGGGIAYSAPVLKELVKNISYFPIGSYVILSNDQKARVVSASGIPMKPMVRITNLDGKEEVVDLSTREDLHIKDMAPHE